jgi:multidrug efflux pump subunit AcrA (membrane-fusion protein)
LAARGEQAVHAVGSLAAPVLGHAPAVLPQRTTFAKDQMVTVYVPLGHKRVETVVPYSAFVFDAFGGAWIYLESTDAKAKTHRFERRRVEMGPVIGGEFVIRPGLTASDRVVVTGAGFLFSREFHSPPVGAGHKQDVDDDD